MFCKDQWFPIWGHGPEEFLKTRKCEEELQISIHASRSTDYNVIVLQNSVVSNLGSRVTRISQEPKVLGRSEHVFRIGHLKKEYNIAVLQISVVFNLWSRAIKIVFRI